MNLHEIDKLLEKYFEGETTLQEESRLRNFFTSGNVPERWKSMEKYFTCMILESNLELPDDNFDDKVLAEVKEDKISVLTDIRRPWIYWMAGVAATALILIAVFVKFDPFSKSIENTYNDPEVAYMEAKKILMYVSAKFNQGTSKLEPVTALEAGLTELKPVAAYNKVVNEVNRLTEVEKVEKMIMNN
jgi:hypothetical protein